MSAAPDRASEAASAISPHVLTLRAELAAGMRPLGTFRLGAREVAVLKGSDAVWAVIRGAEGGGLAMRIAHIPAGIGTARKTRVRRGEAFAIATETPMGRERIAVHAIEGEVPVLRVRGDFTPAHPLLIPYLPRDLYPLGAGDDPLAAKGHVEAAQRGLNTGLCYLRLTEPAFGSALYVQNFTALNARFRLTGTTPDGAVGGKWPELGYLSPTPRQSPQPPLDPLPAGRAVCVYDAVIAFHDDGDGTESEVARRYLTLLAAIFRQLEPPEPDFHDWVDRAERTLRDLSHAPAASIRHYGFRYLHPYTAAEYPDSMVQLVAIASLADYAAWQGKPIPLQRELMRGVRKFYDPRLKTLRRYLPNVGADKDKEAVDSWYLYHPLKSLGRLALDDDRVARRLFLRTIDYAIRAAHHFDYKWPIQYKVTDFAVIQAARDDEGLGQTDVGGMYAYVMLQAFELTDDKRFLDEARAAITAAKGMRFELNYQANLTAWGAAACMRLWRIDANRDWLAQAHVYLASFFHNTAMWESDIGHARHYPNFLGVTALHDAPYMAMYECFDSFAAFEQVLRDGGPGFDAGVRMLVSEYCRYALDRAWFYYPDALPPEAVSDKQREHNGYVDRKLSFPVEDLYVDGQPAGQVGQEIYGAGAAFVFATRVFHRFSDAPFQLFCDHFLLAAERTGAHALSFQLAGGEGRHARLRLLRLGGAKLPRFTVLTAAGARLPPSDVSADHALFDVPADGRISLLWEPPARSRRQRSQVSPAPRR